MPSRSMKHLAHLPQTDDVLAALDKPDELSWRDYLLMLLKIDAGIEHALMVQYLYAAYSLGGEQVPYDQRKRVREWQQTLLSIAKEEMGHLITVQNVITCLGGSLSLDREDYPWDHAFYPFPFELEPLTLDSLAKYVYTEAPIGWGEASPARLAAASTEQRADLEARRNEKAEILQRIGRRPIPPRPDVKSVSALFKVVLAILKTPGLIADEEFNADSFAQQATWAAWACNHGAPSGEDAAGDLSDGDPAKRPKTCPTTANVLVVPVATRDDVIDALEQVAEQGEAPHAEEEQSHFRRFLRIYREYLAHFPEGSAVRPCRDVPVNPTTFKRLRRENGDASARSTLISHPASAKWAALFDMRYRLLLTGLAHTFRLARTSAPQRGPGTYQAVLHRAFGEMYNLKALADILVRQPLSEDPAEPFKPAGPTFQMPYTLDLPENAPSTWQQYRDILSACAEVRAWLRDPAHARLSAQETEYLATQANADQGFEAWLETVQDAARVAGSMMQ